MGLHLHCLYINCYRMFSILTRTVLQRSSSRSSDGNSSLLDEGSSASQVPQASVQLAGYGSVVWPDFLSEWFVDGAGLQ